MVRFVDDLGVDIHSSLRERTAVLEAGLSERVTALLVVRAEGGCRGPGNTTTRRTGGDISLRPTTGRARRALAEVCLWS